MKLMVENNENLPYQYELVGTDLHERIIPNPQLKGYLLIKNPKKHVVNINHRFPPAYSTYYFSTTEEENNRYTNLSVINLYFVTITFLFHEFYYFFFYRGN